MDTDWNQLTPGDWKSADKRLAFYHAVLDRVAQVRGGTRAALTLSLPIEGSHGGSIFTVRDKPVPPRAELPTSAFVPISTGYFAATGIRLRAGRDFDEPVFSIVAIVPAAVGL